MKLRVLDLFSGIGGFSLGLERTGGFETAAFCEIEEYPRKVLTKHWPEVPIYGDVRELTAGRLAANGIDRVDVITGGFPCQDLSASGKKAGIEAERSGLWGQIIRLAGELSPQFILVENVTNLLVGPYEQPGRWFGRVLGDLATLGFDAEWDCIQASSIGAPHGRDRVWIVAYPHQVGRKNSPLGLDPFRQFVRGVAKDVWASEPPEPVILGVDDGFSDWVDRRAALGNAVVPQIPEMIGRAILKSMEAA